ncbi:tyrosine-type recombinase/integrase [Streptomyces sp. NPDC008092]|uniref:tyrosine-type recombinase/integrase n=1 Tax=Streptomyces sp. NPDC008092 TaxID=3364808 RepID=UPI0036F0395E
MADPIKKVILRNGTLRYRFVTDGPRRANGKRRQITKTFDTKTEARGELSRIRHQSKTGEYVAPTRLTVNELLDIWLRASTRDVEEATSTNYDNAVRSVRTLLGEKRVQQLSEEDVEEFVDWLVTCGRRRGGKPGTGLGARSVQLTLGRLRSALNLAVRRGWVIRNVAEHVRISRHARSQARQNAPQRRPWNETEVKAFIEASREHRLFGVMLLTLIAERPAEVCGARWREDVDLSGEGTISVGNTRTIVYDRRLERGQRNKVVEKEPKTDNGKRVLPLPAPVHAALVAYKARQQLEKERAGKAYEDSGYVVVDDLGRPFKTDKLRREAQKLMEEAGVRRVRLYDARHACLSWMANNGVPTRWSPPGPVTATCPSPSACTSTPIRRASRQARRS